MMTATRSDGPLGPLSVMRTATDPAPSPVVPAATVEVPPSDPAVVTESSGGVALPLVGIGVVLALAVGVALGYLARAPRSDRSSVQSAVRPSEPTAPVSAASASPSSVDGSTQGTATPGAVDQLAGQLASERQRSRSLADALIEVRDRIDNPALSERIGTALQSAGWYTVDPTGAPFDPERHRSVDRDSTDDPSLHRTVAITERLGYQDASGNLLRIPEVVVYQHDNGADPYA